MRLYFGFLACLALMLGVAGCHSQGDESSSKAAGLDASGNKPARIVGQVLLQDRKDDASGIQVYVPGTAMVSISDKEGRFALEGVNPGEYEVPGAGRRL